MTDLTVARPIERALVVIPTYQERGNIEIALASALSADERIEVLVVDDGSPDGTADVVARIGATEPRVHLLRRAGKGGLGSAYRAGFGWALERDYDAVVEMDADLSHPADRLPALLDGLTDADLVIGSRWVPGGATSGWPRHRQALSRAGNCYVRIMLGLGVADATAGFRAFRRETLETIGGTSLESEGYCFQVESTFVARQLGLRLAEVPITFTERAEGDSKMSGAIVVEALLRVTGWAFGIARPAATRRAGSRPGRPDAGARQRLGALTPAGRLLLGAALLAVVAGIAIATSALVRSDGLSATATNSAPPVAATAPTPANGQEATGGGTTRDAGTGAVGGAGSGARDANSADTAVPAPGAMALTEPGDVPVRVRIPAIGVDSSLVQLKIARDGTMQVPTDFAKAGWLSTAPAPGDRGPAIIAGHVDDEDGPAVFYKLHTLAPGDGIEVTQRDGDIVTFSVRSVQDFAKDRFPTAKVYGPVPGPVLRLITCGGTFDHETGHYRNNTVVFAS